MIGNRYRLERATLAVRESSERRLLYIPATSVVLVSSLSEDGQFIRVKWEREELAMFTQDLIERTALIEARPRSENFFVATTPTVH
jgi:hypothetical protein